MTAPFSEDRLRDETAVRYAEPRLVRFHDVDAAGTMFYARFFDWASEVYINRLTTAGIDVPGMIARRELAVPLRHVEATYRAPLFFGDRVRVELVAVELGSTSFSLGLRVRAEDDPAKHHAYLQTVHVCIDPRSFRPVPVPDAMRAALLSGQAAP
ncbi:MAG: thioesterase family protein [Polyangiales bacterium]